MKEAKVKLYPTVGLKKPGDHVMANFGQVPFQFDIDGYVKVSIRLFSQTALDDSPNLPETNCLQKQQKMITDNIKQADTSKLAPGLSETKMIQFLVGFNPDVAAGKELTPPGSPISPA